MASTILSFSSSPSFLASNRAGSSPLRSINGPCSVFLPSRPAKLSALRAQATAEMLAAQATGENDRSPVTTLPDTPPTSEAKQTVPLPAPPLPDLEKTSFGLTLVDDGVSEFKLQCVVQGFSKEEVKVTRSPEEDFLFIKIERTKDDDGILWFAKTNIFYHTSHDLPDDCVKDIEKYNVKLEDGVLEITIPKIPKPEEEKLTDIPIM